MSDKGKSLILIVDDNPQNLQFMGNLLLENGYEPAVTQNGVQALEFLQKKKPELILLDIMMPEMDGYEVCRQIKSNSATSHVPIIFISALDDLSAKISAFKVGGVDYVTKPFQVE